MEMQAFPKPQNSSFWKHQCPTLSESHLPWNQILGESARFHLSFFHYQGWGSGCLLSSSQGLFLLSVPVFLFQILLFPSMTCCCMLIKYTGFSRVFGIVHLDIKVQAPSTWTADDLGCPRRCLGEEVAELGRHLSNLGSRSLVYLQFVIIVCICQK